MTRVPQQKLQSKGRRDRVRSAAELMAVISRTLSAKGHAQGLNPAQWSALRYFSSGDTGLRTAASFADYEGISRASANQTVRAMIDKGLLERRKVPGERRALEVIMTERAWRLLTQDPLNSFANMLEQLSDEELRTLSRSLYGIALKMKS